jgi:hypothetical protein
MIRPSTKEVAKLVDSKMLTMHEKHTNDDGVSALRAELVDLRASVERRATVRFVEEALRRKVSKTDLHLAQSRPAAPPAPTFSDLMQVSDELKAKIERGEKRRGEEARRLQGQGGGGAVSRDDLEAVRAALEEALLRKADKGAVEEVRSGQCGYALLL